MQSTNFIFLYTIFFLDNKKKKGKENTVARSTALMQQVYIYIYIFFSPVIPGEM